MQPITERVSDFVRNLNWSLEKVVLLGIMIPVWLIVIGLLGVTLLRDDNSAPRPAQVLLQQVATPHGPAPEAAPAVATQTISPETDFLLDIDVTHRFIWPATGALTSYFGPGHPNGIDISLNYDEDEPVVATAPGKVKFAGGDCCRYGMHVIIDHEDGFSSLYAHLSEISVSEGQEVKQGHLLGMGGNTGDSDGKHLHFELSENGSLVDPLRFLSADQVPAQRLLACPSRMIFVDPASQVRLRFTAASLADTQVTKLNVLPVGDVAASPAARAAFDRDHMVTVAFDSPSAATERTYEYRLAVSLSKGSAAATDIECRMQLRTIPSRPELNGVRRHDPSISRLAQPTKTPTPEPTRPAAAATKTPVPAATPRPPSQIQQAAPVVATPIVAKPPSGSTAPSSSQPVLPAGAPTRIPTKPAGAR